MVFCFIFSEWETRRPFPEDYLDLTISNRSTKNRFVITPLCLFFSLIPPNPSFIQLMLRLGIFDCQYVILESTFDLSTKSN